MFPPSLFPLLTTRFQIGMVVKFFWHSWIGSLARFRKAVKATMRLSFVFALVGVALLQENVLSFQNHASVGHRSKVAFVTSKQTKSSQVSIDANARGIGNAYSVAPRSRLYMGMEEFLTGRDEKQRKVENEKYLAEQQKRVEKINSLEAEIEELDDDELIGKTQEFKERLKNGEDLNGPLLEEAFAVVREAAW